MEEEEKKKRKKEARKRASGLLLSASQVEKEAILWPTGTHRYTLDTTLVCVCVCVCYTRRQRRRKEVGVEGTSTHGQPLREERFKREEKKPTAYRRRHSAFQTQ
jgi:hypothetical protein